MRAARCEQQQQQQHDELKGLQTQWLQTASIWSFREGKIEPESTDAVAVHQGIRTHQRVLEESGRGDRTAPASLAALFLCRLDSSHFRCQSNGFQPAAETEECDNQEEQRDNRLLSTTL